MIHHPRTFHFSPALQGFGFFFKGADKYIPFGFHFSNGPDKNLRFGFQPSLREVGGGGGGNKNWKVSLAMSIIVLKGTYRNGSIKTHNFMILESYETAHWNLLLLLTSQSSDFSQLYGGHRTYM